MLSWVHVPAEKIISSGKQRACFFPHRGSERVLSKESEDRSLLDSHDGKNKNM